MWGSFFKEYFTFSRGERNGIFVLLSIIITLTTLPFFLESFKPDKSVDFTAFEEQVAEFKQRQALALEKKLNPDTVAFELFQFDPNQLSDQQWQLLGVSEKTTRTIINYRNKGGHFDEKTDLLKIYGFDSARYELLEPYIVFAEPDEKKDAMDLFDKTAFNKKDYERKYSGKEDFREQKKIEYKPKPAVIVELNTADSTELTQVKGIGPVLSKRIIKFRDRLGGFERVEQLKEVYGLDSTWLDVMQKSLTVDPSLITKIDVNNVSQEALEKHPYIGRNVARVIINYRQQHGSFKNLDDLKKIYIIDDSLFRKITPYLTVD